jgi:hypothetical protein
LKEQPDEEEEPFQLLAPGHLHHALRDLIFIRPRHETSIGPIKKDLELPHFGEVKKMFPE